MALFKCKAPQKFFGEKLHWVCSTKNLAQQIIRLLQ